MVSSLRLEFSFETLPTLIPRWTWMICSSQCSESPSRIHLNHRKALMASHEDHQVSLLYRQYFEWFGMVTQCNLYVVSGIPKAQPLPPQSSVSPWILSMGAMLYPCGREERRLCGSVIVMKTLDGSPDFPNVAGSE